MVRVRIWSADAGFHISDEWPGQASPTAHPRAFWPRQSVRRPASARREPRGDVRCASVGRAQHRRVRRTSAWAPTSIVSHRRSSSAKAERRDDCDARHHRHDGDAALELSTRGRTNPGAFQDRTHVGALQLLLIDPHLRLLGMPISHAGCASGRNGRAPRLHKIGHDARFAPATPIVHRSTKTMRNRALFCIILA